MSDTNNVIKFKNKRPELTPQANKATTILANMGAFNQPIKSNNPTNKTKPIRVWGEVIDATSELATDILEFVGNRNALTHMPAVTQALGADGVKQINESDEVIAKDLKKYADDIKQVNERVNKYIKPEYGSRTKIHPDDAGEALCIFTEIFDIQSSFNNATLPHIVKDMTLVDAKWQELNEKMKEQEAASEASQTVDAISDVVVTEEKSA